MTTGLVLKMEKSFTRWLERWEGGKQYCHKIYSLFLWGKPNIYQQYFLWETAQSDEWMLSPAVSDFSHWCWVLWAERWHLSVSPQHHIAGTVTQQDRFPTAATRGFGEQSTHHPDGVIRADAPSLVLPAKAYKAFLTHLTLVCSLGTTTTFAEASRAELFFLDVNFTNDTIISN